MIPAFLRCALIAGLLSLADCFARGFGGQMYGIPDLALTAVMTSDPSPHPREEGHVGDLHALLDRGIVPAAIRGGA